MVDKNKKDNVLEDYFASLQSQQPSQNTPVYKPEVYNAATGKPDVNSQPPQPAQQPSTPVPSVGSNLLAAGVNPNAIQMGGTNPTPAPNNPLHDFLRSGILPTAGAIAGGAVGGALGGGVGAVPGAGIGGAGAELIRRGMLRLMGENPDADPQGKGEDKGIIGDLQGAAVEGTLDSLFQGIGGLAGKALAKSGQFAADTFRVNPENFAQRAMKLSPTEFAKASAKQGIATDADKTIYNVLLGDKNNAGQGIFDVAPEDWHQYAMNRKSEIMTKIEAAAKDYGEKGLSYSVDDLNKQLKDSIMPKLSFQGKGAGTLKDGSQQVIDVIDKNFKNYKKAYGDTLSPNNILELRRSLDSDLNAFKPEGAIDVGKVQMTTANFLRNKIATDMPAVNDQNKLYSAYADVENKFDAKLRPDASLGYSFGSAVQSLPAEQAVLAATGSPHLAAGAYVANFVGSQVMKNPNFAGKAASVLFNIKNMGADAPPLAKTFYNALQPSVVQLLDSGATHRGSPKTTADGSSLAASMLPSGDQAGMNDIPGGQFKTKDDLTNPDGTPNTQRIGITPHDVLLAMLADPKHSSLYKDIYGIVKDQGTDGLTANQKTAMSKVDAAYAVLNKAEESYGKLTQTGIVGGNIALAGNALSGGAVNPDIAAYETLRQGTLPILARVIGGDVGNLNEQEQMRAKFLPQVTDSLDVAKKKFAMLQYLLDTRKSQVKSDPNGGIINTQSNNSSSSAGSDTLSNTGL